MAEDGPVTPEKQLLRLIEEKGSQSKPRSRAARGPAGARPSVSAIAGMIAGYLSFFRRSAGSGLHPKGKFKISFPFVNRVLAAGAAALFLYLMADAAASAVSLGRPLNLSPKKERAAASAPAAAASPLNESAYYLQKVASRDIFKEASEARPKKGVSEEPISPQDDPATSSLSLVGISWSSNPDVIIEDKERKRTYFVKRGQVVGDNVKVEAIFKDHVVLSHEGREFELR